MKTFNNVELVSEDGKFKAVWEWLGEGVSGEYQQEDPDDVPLLRFTCYVKTGEMWEQIDDASYCTQMPIFAPKHCLQRGLKSILRELKDSYPNHKSAMEWMSWISPNDLKE